MESHPSPQELLVVLERDRQQVRARLPLPWWQHAGWGITWCVFSVSTVVMTESNWIFLVYLCTSVTFVALWRTRLRMQGLRLARPRDPAWKLTLHAVAGVALGLGMILLSLALDSRWPWVVGCIAFAVVIFLVSIRDDRLQATRLRDER